MTILSLKVSNIIEENRLFKTYVFKHGLNAHPGQFVMVWMPGVDEVPMSVGWVEADEFRIGIFKAGDCTTAIHEQIKVGDRLGIRGPFGKGFDLKDYKKIALVGGGCGTPPMLSIAQKAVEKGIEVTAIIGAGSEELLIYEKEFKKLGCKVLVSTDDGSKGHKGFVTDVLEKELEKGKQDCVYTCGPEKMMVKVIEIAKDHKIHSQVSLERFMKCGFGICGQCCIDGTGLRVCKDGPVFDGEVAMKHKEFGKYARSASGKRCDL
ncbi:dihydroorotate dehydrogenase electron transfer subunit [Patescibacteria group bacterium]|nr:dihydroorotate dehydrogenase electron transfer subunit [Patescibacteria group bacterium]